MDKVLQGGMLAIEGSLADELNALAKLEQHEVSEAGLIADEELLFTDRFHIAHNVLQVAHKILSKIRSFFERSRVAHEVRLLKRFIKHRCEHIDLAPLCDRSAIARLRPKLHRDVLDDSKWLSHLQVLMEQVRLVWEVKA